MTNDEKSYRPFPSLGHSSVIRHSSFELRHSWGLFLRLAFRRIFLRLDHHAFDGVNRAQHLRIARTNLRFLVPDFGVAVARNEKGMLLFSRHWHCNIRRDSVPMDNLLTRGVVLRGGKT